MKTIKDCETLQEAIDMINKVVTKAQTDKSDYGLSDKILVSNLAHDLDTILHYVKSEGRK